MRATAVLDRTSTLIFFMWNLKNSGRLLVNFLWYPEVVAMNLAPSGPKEDQVYHDAELSPDHVLVFAKYLEKCEFVEWMESFGRTIRT